MTPTYCTSGRLASRCFCNKSLFLPEDLVDKRPGRDPDIGDSVIFCFVPGEVNICPLLRENKKYFKFYFVPAQPSPTNIFYICGQFKA